MNRDEIRALLAFNRVTNYTARQKLELYEKFGSTLKLFHSGSEAEEQFGKPFKINGNRLRYEAEMESAECERARCEAEGISVIGIHGSDYPVRLRCLLDPPLVLFAKGQTGLLRREFAVGVVGARKASNAGLTLAYCLGRDLSSAGAVVVSGLAAGVDLYAHRGALQGNGATIAVLGNGVDVAYPKESAEVYRQIAEEGCVLSEFPLGTPPLKYNFPRRNRIISGLALGVVVVEASESSGALITARHALEQKKMVMAFPGRAGSECFCGNNNLIKRGAKLVEDASDILSALGRGGGTKALKPESSGSALERDILKVIGDERVSIETIERVLKSPISDITSELMMLELRGTVVQHPGKIFSRVCQHG